MLHGAGKLADVLGEVGEEVKLRRQHRPADHLAAVNLALPELLRVDRDKLARIVECLDLRAAGVLSEVDRCLRLHGVGAVWALNHEVVLQNSVALIAQLHMRAAGQVLRLAAASQLHAAQLLGSGFLEAGQVLVVAAHILAHALLHDAVLEKRIVAEKDRGAVHQLAGARVKACAHDLQHTPAGRQHGLGEAREHGVTADGAEVNGRSLRGKRLGDDLVACPV